MRLSKSNSPTCGISCNGMLPIEVLCGAKLMPGHFTWCTPERTYSFHLLSGNDLKNRPVKERNRLLKKRLLAINFNTPMLNLFTIFLIRLKVLGGNPGL